MPSVSYTQETAILLVAKNKNVAFAGANATWSPRLTAPNSVSWHESLGNAPNLGVPCEFGQNCKWVGRPMPPLQRAFPGHNLVPTTQTKAVHRD
eukprot:scaffold90578_cov53-Phaeocystis_antarctica.AAC.1